MIKNRETMLTKGLESPPLLTLCYSVKLLQIQKDGCIILKAYKQITWLISS
jgi:hypothetical protein